jgi:CheY-like chemotaxis protein
MVRPTLLVAEPEPLQAISTRKLVLETAKFNVLTAHSTQEGLQLLRLFPNVSAAVLVNGQGIDCPQIADQIRQSERKISIIGLSARAGDHCDFADHNISSYDPESLVHLVRQLLGDPRQLDGK